MTEEDRADTAAYLRERLREIAPELTPVNCEELAAVELLLMPASPTVH